MTARTSILILALAVLCSCGSKGPQRPSQRKGETPKEDSTQLALMEMTFRMAEAADKAVEQTALAQKEAYALYNAHAWIHIANPGMTEGPTLQAGNTYALHMRVHALDGRLLTDEEMQYTMGKSELPPAVNWNLREMYPGAQIRIIAPWYTAYGQSGTDHVPPYENVIIDLEIEE